jgi:hypothetical protein
MLRKINLCILLFSIGQILLAQKSDNSLLDHLEGNVKDSIVVNNGSVKIFNVYKSQYKCLNKFNLDNDTACLIKDYINHTYIPYSEFWKPFGNDSLGYISDYVLNNTFDFSELSKRINEIAYIDIGSIFERIIVDMENSSGYKVKGNWYIGFNEKSCDLGGDGKTMLIDLNHDNFSIQHIIETLPHEFCHQIFRDQNYKDTMFYSGLGLTLNEGLATYVGYIYGDSLAHKALMFSEKEYEWCNENEDMIFRAAESMFFSRDWQVVSQYFSPDKKIYEHGPSKLGYFVGFRMCQKYIKKYGRDSWKDFFRYSLTEIYNRLDNNKNNVCQQKIKGIGRE